MQSETQSNLTANEPLVSIIVPVFNREKLIRQLVETVVAQTYQSWELLFIDDNSSDKTVDFIKQYMSDEPRIKLHFNKHSKGPSGARNYGLDVASGKYIAYQDSDDEWAPHHLARSVYFLEKYPEKIDLMTANPLRKKASTKEVYHYDELDLSTLPHQTLEDGYLINKDVLFDKQLHGRVITTQCLVGKAETLKSTRWNEDLAAAVDIMHNLELCAQNIGVCHLQDYHAIYWAHDDNLTNVSGQHSPERMERVHGAFAYYWELVLANMPLTSQQKSYVYENLSECYAWHLAYHTFEPQKKYRQALTYYAKAIRLTPFKLKLYISYIKAFIKRLIK